MNITTSGVWIRTRGREILVYDLSISPHAAEGWSEEHQEMMVTVNDNIYLGGTENTERAEQILNEFHRAIAGGYQLLEISADNEPYGVHNAGSDRHGLGVARAANVTQTCGGLRSKKWGPCGICETTLENWHEEALCAACWRLLNVATGSLRADRKALKDLVTRVKENYTMRSN